MSNSSGLGGLIKLFDSRNGTPAPDVVQLFNPSTQKFIGGLLGGLANIPGAILGSFTAGAGTITGADSILSALQKLQGNILALGNPLVFTATWNASTNTPTLTSGSGTAGNCYKVTTAGTTTLDGINQWNVGDIAVFSSVTSTWWKIDGISLEVTSVAGRTGAVTLTDNDIAGRTNGSSAASGIIGQVLSSTVVSGSAVSVTTATITNVTSLVLPAGDWDVQANIFISDSAVSLTSSAGGLVTTAGTFPDSSANAQLNTTGNSSSMANAWGSPVPKLVVNSSGSTTVYLQTYCTFATGTVTACGQIQARRI